MTISESNIIYRARGRCHCNYTTFEFDGEVVTCFTCHCTDCQASNGSAFTQNMIVPANALKLVGGKLCTFSYTHQDRPLEVHCCDRCASALWLIFTDSEDYASLQLGTLIDQTPFAPVAHIWKSSRVAWLRLDDQIASFDTEPEFAQLEELWREKERQNQKQGG